ncbi:MAG: hypothetical protein ACRC6U_11300 [Fusobacteriaceae bacterium]
MEGTFAHNLENNKNVVVYPKLPAWLKIRIPLGKYNPV